MCRLRGPKLGRFHFSDIGWEQCFVVLSCWLLTTSHCFLVVASCCADMILGKILLPDLA
jgi:hypothetical protein